MNKEEAEWIAIRNIVRGATLNSSSIKEDFYTYGLSETEVPFEIEDDFFPNEEESELIRKQFNKIALSLLRRMRKLEKSFIFED